MQFDYGTIMIAAMLIVAPALIAFVSVKRHVSKFIRDVQREEEEEKRSRRDEETPPRKN